MCLFTGCIIIRDVIAARNSNPFEMAAASQGSSIFAGVDFYMILMMVGLLVTVVLAVLRRNLLGIRPVTAAVIAVVFFLQAYLGAKLLYGFEGFVTSVNIYEFDMDGQSLYGTIWISFLFIPVLAKLLKADVRKVFDYIAPSWIILLAFVRTGCFITGCCGADPCAFCGVSIVLPVQLFEVILDLIIMQLVFSFEAKAELRNRMKVQAGDTFFMMIGLYGFYRFFLEFIRSSEVIAWGLTFGQMYSIIVIIIAVCYIALNRKKSTKEHKI